LTIQHLFDPVFEIFPAQNQFLIQCFSDLMYFA